MTDSLFDSKLCRDVKLPMILLVVYIHCFGMPSEVSIYDTDWSNLTPFDFYNIVRVALSKVLSSVAVPLFFFISGYYFFFGEKNHISAAYFLQKFKKRFSTLFIPYIIWISLYILLKFGLLLLNASNSIDSIVEYINEKGGIFAMYWGCEVWNAHIVNVFGDFPANVNFRITA